MEAAEERNAMIFSLLQQHPWTKQSGSERTYAVTRSGGTEEEVGDGWRWVVVSIRFGGVGPLVLLLLPARLNVICLPAVAAVGI